MHTVLLPDDERALINAVEAMAATRSTRSAEHVVLDQGRLLTARPWPRRGAPRRGRPGQCHRNSLRVARITGGVYVEGYALGPDGMARPHAWCVASDGAVLDPTWPGGRAHAYLGVPMSTEFVLAFQGRTLTRTCFRGVLDTEVQVTRDANRIFTAGVPSYGLIDVGRPLELGCSPPA
ncbi:hypothetical protein [Kitasatospora sp. NPDC088779]|uniref:hypothetical protein n=1 Tax=unclassified Kitasatospora TaxID=2633591 RepID=UPI0034455106